MEAIAKARFQRIAPRKARVVLNLIRGKNVAQAIDELRWTKKSAAPIVLNGVVIGALWLAAFNVHGQEVRAFAQFAGYFDTAGVERILVASDLYAIEENDRGQVETLEIQPEL